VRIVASPEAIASIRERGGLLFVRPVSYRGPRLVLTLLKASLDPPDDAFDYCRFDHGQFLLFLHPFLRSAPEELWVEVRERGAPEPRVYWNGVAFVG
jgi:hypothetical protein